MRARVALPVLAVALLALVAVAPFAAGDHPKQHFEVVQSQLGPGEAITLHAQYQGGPLREGWVLLVAGGVIPSDAGSEDDARLTGEVTLDGETVMAWTWESHGGVVQFATRTLPATSENYEITLTNPGDGDVQAFFYFDQTCNCFSKPLTHFPATWSMFNFDYYAGEQVWMDWELPEGTELQYEVLRRTGGDGVYPGDYEKVAIYPRDALPNGTITWEVPEAETYYLLARAHGSEPGGQIVPKGRVSSIDEGPAGGGSDGGGGLGIPAPGPAALIAAAGAVAAVTRRRGRRRRPRA